MSSNVETLVSHVSVLALLGKHVALHFTTTHGKMSQVLIQEPKPDSEGR